MRAADIIIAKRGSGSEKGRELSQEEIQFMVKGYVEGSIPDYQMSAFLMAVYFSGMTFRETGWLTHAMLHSGETISLYGEEYAAMGLKGPFVDKHSTGGVGDKISLPLAPIVAACGVQIPMMSGRGLGHTGGTLDKLESIEGYNVKLTADKFRAFIAENGYGMTGQTEKIVPADRLMYALRDVTGTVESIPLITSSILSKKVAEGSDALVFDVKYGNGAFMKSLENAKTLAESLVNTAKAMGKKATAFITNMNTPLGFKTGNYLEIEETLECLQGNGPDDVMELTYSLGAEMVVLGGKAKTFEEAKEMCRDAVVSGTALMKFLENVRQQGGDPDRLLEQQNKRRSEYHKEITAWKDGYVSIHAYKTGCACIDLGVGRTKTTDAVCADAGIIFAKRQGDYVKKGEKLLDVYARDEAALENGSRSLLEAVAITEEKPQELPLIADVIRSN